MTKREAQRYVWLCEALRNHGILQDDVDTLLRCSRALHTWAEHECNGAIQRGDNGKPAWYNTTSGMRIGTTPDRETGALKRIAAILAPHAPKQYTADTCPGRPCGSECDHKSPGLTFYHQGDPRGCCLYILRPGDVPEGKDPGSCYSNGIAVCID